MTERDVESARKMESVDKMGTGRGRRGRKMEKVTWKLVEIIQSRSIYPQSSLQSIFSSSSLNADLNSDFISRRPIIDQDSLADIRWLLYTVEAQETVNTVQTSTLVYES